MPSASTRSAQQARSFFTNRPRTRRPTLAAMRTPADSPALATVPTLPARALIKKVSGTPGWLQRRWPWLGRGFGWLAPARPKTELKAARRACIECLADLPAPKVRALCQLLANAKTLPELLQLRAEVYRLLALHHSQAEAERRLALAGVFMERRGGGPRQRQR